MQRAVLELSNVLYSTRQALLCKGRKHFEALNTKALTLERLEAAQMCIERSLNALIIGKIPMRIKVKGLGRCIIVETIELDLVDPAL